MITPRRNDARTIRDEYQDRREERRWRPAAWSGRTPRRGDATAPLWARGAHLYRNHAQTGLDHEHQIPVYGYVTVSAFPLDTDIAQTATTTNARAFTMVPAGILTRTWTDLLQLGDEPVLAWWANNTPRDLRRMGLTYDELHLSIFRDRQERCRFYIAASVCRADVADRMIRLGLG